MEMDVPVKKMFKHSGLGNGLKELCGLMFGLIPGLKSWRVGAGQIHFWSLFLWITLWINGLSAAEICKLLSII